MQFRRIKIGSVAKKKNVNDFFSKKIGQSKTSKSIFLTRNSSGFTLIDLLVSLLIISVILVFAIDEYMRYIETAKITRAKVDIDELIKSVRLYNIRENKSFSLATFSPEVLGNFIGNYLESDPPTDPWGSYYLHSKKLGIVYSKGSDGKDQSSIVAGDSDDIALSYLPSKFFISRAEYVDANMNNAVDYGDYIAVRFSRPARLKGVVATDFETIAPKGALGSAVIRETEDPFLAIIELSPPLIPTLIPGNTRLSPRADTESIVDMSPKPQFLKPKVGAIIEKRKLY